MPQGPFLPRASEDFARIGRLFRLRPDAHLTLLVDFDVDQIGATADGAILDVLLRIARRKVERDDDLFSAGIADIGGFVMHGLHCFRRSRMG